MNARQKEHLAKRLYEISSAAPGGAEFIQTAADLNITVETPYIPEEQIRAVLAWIQQRDQTQ